MLTISQPLGVFAREGLEEAAGRSDAANRGTSNRSISDCSPKALSGVASATPRLTCPKQPDELELLLAALRLRHWRGCIVTLLDQYDGWGAGRHQGGNIHDTRTPDCGPLADVIAVLDNLPSELAGQDRAFARALLACPFLLRAAQDAHSGEPWEPLEQRFRDFTARRAVHLVLMPGIPWPGQDFIDWTLEQLVCSRASRWGRL